MPGVHRVLEDAVHSGVIEMSVLWRGTVLDVVHFPSLQQVRMPQGLTLKPGAVLPLKAEVDGLTIRLQSAQPEIPTSRARRTPDLLFFQTLLGTVTLHTVLMVLAQVLPHDEEPVLDLSKNRQAIHAVLTVPQVKKPPRPVAAPRERGKAGAQQAKVQHARRTTGGARVPDRQKRQEDRKVALSALSFLNIKSGATARVMGNGGVDQGINVALGNLTHGVTADVLGNGGLATRGVGPGGSGGPLNIGVLGGDPHGPATDVLGPGHKTRPVINVRCTSCAVEGGLTREEIARVIQRHINQVRYCYEKELNRAPNLSGKVSVAFLIDGAGRVTTSDISESSMDDATVETCVTSVIKRMQFPQPRGGVVQVNYPFVFQSSGG